jgi:protein SCO1/2
VDDDRLLHRRRVRALLLAVVAAVAPLAACGADEAAGLAGVVREPALQVASVELPAAADGEPHALRADDGELLVVYFGYTSCPDICPTTLSDVGAAIAALPAEDADRVTVAFATVDPERDTAAVMDDYLAHFVSDGVALRTEDPDELVAATEAFGASFEVEDHEEGEGGYAVAHTAVTYVVDDTGAVVVEWPFGFEIPDMTSDLTTLLDQETT